MFGLRNELFGFPVNSCDYEAIDCNRSYIPILNWDNDNEFVWSLGDPLEGGVDASNVSFNNRRVQKRPSNVTKVDQALETLRDMIDESKSTVKSFTFALNEDGETLEGTITYEDDSGTEYTKTASINLKNIVEGWESLTLHDITADSITAQSGTFDTITINNTFTFESPVIMNSTLEVNGAITATAGADITGGLTSDTVTTTGDVTVGGDLSVTGDETITGDLSVTGNETVTGNLTVSGNETITGTVTFNGEVTMNDDLIIADDLTVGGSTHLNDVETTGSVDIAGTLRVEGAINGGNGITIDGQVESDSLVTGNAVIDTLHIREGIYLENGAVAPDFVLQAEKGEPNGVCPLDANGKVNPQYLPPVYTTAIVKMGTGIFSNSDTSVVVDADITADSFIAISNYSDIIGDLNEVINVGQLTVVSNQTETGSYKYIIVNPLPNS